MTTATTHPSLRYTGTDYSNVPEVLPLPVVTASPDEFSDAMRQRRGQQPRLRLVHPPESGDIERGLHVQLFTPKIPQEVRRALRRDSVRLATIGLIFFKMIELPLRGAMALEGAVRPHTKGDFYFEQTRVQRTDERVTNLMTVKKVRTMTQDEKVTWVGKLLRCTHLDELPQCENVLKGDMNVFGVRAYSLEDYKKAHGQGLDHWYWRTADIEAGIVGLSAARQQNSKVADFEDVLAGDMETRKSLGSLHGYKAMRSKAFWGALKQMLCCGGR